MNIKEAKQEIKNTLKVYLRKDEKGRYLFPAVRQRPILLMGPPGIGKTAILEQAAAECGVGLVAYAMTHHTRQSAIGLPHIETAEFDGVRTQVTEYTMSEIVAEIYRTVNRTGKKEGILFLDEINCVSETLAPAMLQLLQCKTFGNHRIPEGWIIVAAGNPPEYNKSVREFDVATLDRVRTIPVEADCDVFLDYAAARKVHGAILSYLSIRPEQFYLVECSPDRTDFVTARGWEDLSEMLRGCEALDIPVTRALVGEYLQKEEVAAAFAAYYQLYRKYREDYALRAVLDGSLSRDALARRIGMAESAGFEERFTVVRLLTDALCTGFDQYADAARRLDTLHRALLRLRSSWGEGPGAMAAGMRKSLQVLAEAGLADGKKQDTELWAAGQLEAYELALQKDHIHDPGAGMDRIRELFKQDTDAFAAMTGSLQGQLQRAFAFLEEAFGEGQELVLFVTALTREPSAMTFLAANGSPEFLRHSDALLFKQQEQTLLEECRRAVF